MAFSQEYPNITAALKTLAVSALIGVAIALYGNWRYDEGVEQGRVQTLCEIGYAQQIAGLPRACFDWIERATPKDTPNA